MVYKSSRTNQSGLLATLKQQTDELDALKKYINPTSSLTADAGCGGLLAMRLTRMRDKHFSLQEWQLPLWMQMAQQPWSKPRVNGFNQYRHAKETIMSGYEHYPLFQSIPAHWTDHHRHSIKVERLLSA
jgi:hypothetical protein